MSQNFNRGLENEYLVPYISFTTHPQSGSIVGGGTTTLTAVAAASTGIGYFNYRWYQDDVLSGGITTALSGVTTTRSYTLDYAGGELSRVVNYKVSAEWVPDNSDIIVSHGTPGVGATGVGVGQSISGYSPSGETFSNVGVVSVAPAITVNIVAVGVQPLGFNTSAYSLERTLSVNATISNGDNGNLAYQWKNAGTNVSGATSSSYVFTPGYVGVNTYTCLVSYPPDELVSSVTSDSITDNATDLTQTVRIEVVPAGGEKRASSSAYVVYSIDVDLSNHTDGYKIDLDKVKEIVASRGGSRNTSVYAWENYYYVSVFAIDDNILKTEYNALVTGNKLKMVNLLRDKPEDPFNIKISDLNTYNIDRFVNYANKHNMKKRGHVMIWYKQIPNWLDEESKTWTSQQIYDFTESYIRALSRYTNGKIDEWDVLNEAIVFNGYRTNTWYEKVSVQENDNGEIGYLAYFSKLFKWAREENPDVKLFYNDYGIEEYGTSKNNLMRSMVKNLKTQFNLSLIHI